MSPAGRKPQSATSPAAKPATFRLHPLGCYIGHHETLRDLVVDHLGENWARGYDVDALTVAARRNLNAALALHGLRIDEDDVFFTNSDMDDDSDLVIGRALLGLDVDALAARHRLTSPA